MPPSSARRPGDENDADRTEAAGVVACSGSCAAVCIGLLSGITVPVLKDFDAV
jgi:hypothetical protein